MKVLSLALFLVLLSGLGCRKQTECTLTGIQYYIPNVINLADPTNNVFYALSTFEELVVETLSVYNNTGHRVFHNEQFPVNEAKFGWDGIIDGQYAASGTYSYHVIFSDGDEVACHAGDFTLIR